MRKTSLKSIFAVLALSLLIIGCAEEKSAQPASSSDDVPFVVIPNGPFVPTGSGPGVGGDFGAQAPLTIESLATMSDYTGRPMNEVVNPKVHVNFKRIGSGFGGVIAVTYTENGIQHEGHFTTGASAAEVKFNQFFVSGGKQVFHAVLEDFIGGFVIVIDDVIDLGDGISQGSANGSIWYKNFGLTFAPHPPTRCWFVSLGPYDCRPWPSGTSMNTTQSVNPQAGYIKLATFTDLDLNEAFNGDL